MRAVLSTVMEGDCLTRSQAQGAMLEILEGSVSPEQLAAFLAAVHARTETVEELLGFLEAMRDKAVRVPVQRRDLIDTCGTGGDGGNTFNISTAAAFIVAGAGVGVAKHGNRSVSSRCGSADVLEALGVPVDLSPERAATAIDERGFGFLFAPLYHPALAAVAPVRRSLGVRTLFNVLAPLANPARVERQLIGVYHSGLLPTVATLLREMGLTEAMVVCSEDGLDEVSLSAPTEVAHLSGGMISYRRIQPEDFGLERSPKESLCGGDAAQNAATIEKILSAEEVGPRRDVVVMNAAAALVVAGVVRDLREGAAVAAETIRTGRAAGALVNARKAE